MPVSRIVAMGAAIGTVAAVAMAAMPMPGSPVQAQDQGESPRVRNLLVNRSYLIRHPGVGVAEIVQTRADEGLVVITYYMNLNRDAVLSAPPAGDVLTPFEASEIQFAMLTDAIPEIADQLREDHPDAEFRTFSFLLVVIEDHRGPVYKADYEAAFENNMLDISPELSGIPYATVTIDESPHDGNSQATVEFDFSVARDGSDRLAIETAADTIPAVLKDVLRELAVVSES